MMSGARYWRHQDQRYNMAGNECGVCGSRFFPGKTMCPNCHRRSVGKMKKFYFNGNGKIITYTIIHEGSLQYRNQVPYLLAIIELEEGDKVLGQIVDCEASDLAMGKKVEMVFRKLGEQGKSGTIQYGYKFILK
ncbi:MAG: Zn-ribbon domain-containing OB-fold protein [Candidatus Thermoplasmatota archaeon]|jgi:hypothetical protein|nr:Zn-ribbon domain-containing OB-fold protein [Candidatus Thermoplasmatota archaeon]